MITLYYPNFGQLKATFDNNQWTLKDGRPMYWELHGTYGACSMICKDLQDFIKLAYNIYTRL